MKKSYLIAAFFCALSPLAQAATDTTLDEIVVTTTRIEQPLKQTLSSTSVITQEDIKNSQATDVATILRSVAGVEISQSGGTGKSTYLYLRGSSESQVLVLLDGVRINSATTGTTSIEHLMLDQIERIEVVRGNVSSLYGSEAIGGVVQIFTKHGHGAPVFNASSGIGSHGTQRMAAGFGGSVENTDLSLHVSRFMTDGVSALNPGIYPKANPANNGYDNTSVSANLRHAFNADHSLAASVFNSQGHNQYDNAYGLPTDNFNSDVQVSKFSLTSDDRLSESWQSKIQLAQGVDSQQNFKNGLPATPGSLYKTTNQQLTWQNTLQLDAGKQLLAGVEYLGQKVSSDLPPAYVQDERQVNSLFAGYTGNYGAHQLQMNARQDNNSQYGTANTGLLGYGYAFSDKWRATTSYSTAFRAPSFNQLYYPGYGNAALKPERSINTEAGLHYTSNEHNVDVTYFDNHTTDLIAGSPVQNINEARTDGWELSYAGQFGDTGVKAAATSQNPRDANTGAQLPHRAKQHGSVAFTQKLDALQLGAEWLYSDARMDGVHTLDSYSVFNFTAAYALNKQLKLSLRADNLTDQNDSNVYGYNPLGRSYFVNISYQQ
jgi:vitamin B12 transporter